MNDPTQELLNQILGLMQDAEEFGWNGCYPSLMHAIEIEAKTRREAYLDRMLDLK